ncbi:MAG: lysophospholipid acyltransferase family protein, partial [Thermoanaerobaculia bacterium]
ALLGALERALAGLTGRLDWSGAQALGRGLGRLGWALAPRDRRRTLEHLGIAFPELPAEQRRRLARASFRHFGAMLAECLWLRERDSAELRRRVELEGWREIELARSAARPVLILTGHCGNWELLAAALNVNGLGMAVVARELEDPGLQDALLGLRARFGTRTIVRGKPGAARDLLRTLRSGGALGMLIDQDTKVDGVWVPFFGRPAWTPVGAAEIARRLSAAVLPTFIERLPDGRHRAVVHPELELPGDPVAATAMMTARIEEQIRRVPEQWVWMHRRWRHQPTATG